MICPKCSREVASEDWEEDGHLVYEQGVKFYCNVK